MQEMTGATLQDIMAFVAVAQTGSFTSAAERLGTNKSSVGKAVQRLEKHLATQLFQRTTRAVHITEDGQTYLAAARVAIDRLREAEQALAANRAEPVGRVRVDLPAGFGRLILPTLGALRERYPKVVVELSLNDRMSDPVGDGWDIVVRIGHLPADSEMTVRKICDLQLGLYASPAYLQQRDAIASISDLMDHDAVLFRSFTGQLRGWSLNDHGQRREFAPTPALILDGHAFVEAAVLGLGISQMIDRFARPFVLDGRLVHVLPQADVPAPPVHALIPVGRKMTAKTRVVLDHIVATLQQ
ncbi:MULTISPECIES: LysR family transcriptional regulator [unclassified Duganella]|uniref:LysR family transcriptional regulator n=1 Tax=unclassified Duganella TaxID=2636909 RepID=UPI0008855073|nr:MULTISPECIES: LysR family transcriptional regulator [unclassified Duganella]SDF37994.1 DNA-binding transcriptional regulator, LysR family [Duganella sp. OV458]SDI88325.1 DNA-binding transcriptional regulator, LysR family [Duganella sp. OV510]